MVAVGGFGDGKNAYAHSMAWFDGCLYVGTTRDNLCLVAARNPLAMKVWPVKCEDPPDYQGLRAEVWRYTPATDAWERVFRSPMIDRDGTQVMRDIGYRGMTVFQAPCDPAPALYVGTWSATGSRMMRSYDGRRFEEVGPVGLGYPSIVCVRTLQAWRGRLFTSPIGRAGRGPNEAELAAVLETDNPSGGRWTLASAPGFGDPRNTGVFELQVFEDQLYATTINYREGFQLWRTRAAGSPPYHWEKVLTAGAYRGLDNETGVSLCPFRGTLYVGTGITGGGYNRYHGIGPAAAEILRVHPDGSWELVMGMPRVTPDGLKVPVSGLGPGFENFWNGYVWRMGEHDGWLYAGTYNWAVFLPFLTMQGFPEGFVREAERRGVRAMTAEFAGAEIWRSQDGTHWQPVTRDGFGNPFNFGFRNFVSTSAGLFVGSANPFGPLVADESPEGWTYRPNPRGGCEVWLGREGGSRGSRSLPVRAVPARTALRRVFRRLDEDIFGWLTDDHYERSGFDQMGYWGDGARSLREACEALCARLLAMAGGARGTVLDLECGKGGSTRFLLRHYRPEDVTAVGRRRREWHALGLEWPGLTLLEMEPGRLDLPDRAFDTVFCVERAAAVPSRATLLAEALRVLRPGGRLVMADTLFSRTGEAADWSRSRHNYLAGVSAYRGLLARVGFVASEVVDVTDAGADAWRTHVARLALGDFRAGRMTAERFNPLMSRVARVTQLLRLHLLIGATRP